MPSLHLLFYTYAISFNANGTIIVLVRPIITTTVLLSLFLLSRNLRQHFDLDRVIFVTNNDDSSPFFVCQMLIKIISNLVELILVPSINAQAA